MYIQCLLIFLQPGMANKLLTLVPLLLILLPVAVNSLSYPILSSSNVSLVLPFMDLVITT